MCVHVFVSSGCTCPPCRSPSPAGSRSFRTSTVLWRVRSSTAPEGETTSVSRELMQPIRASETHQLLCCVSQVHVHLRCAGHREDGHSARSDALSSTCGRRGRDPSLPLHRDQRDEDDGSSSGLRPDPAGHFVCSLIYSSISSSFVFG